MSRLESTTGLVPGDVVIVAVQMRATGGGHYWWRRFCCVLQVTAKRHALLLSLKMQIDEDRDIREVDFTRDVVEKIEEHAWPQGVTAMRMKWIMKGVIKLGGEGLT